MSADGFFFYDGDIDNNGVTDVHDLDLINQWVGPTGPAMFIEEMDINLDKVVDKRDVFIVKEYLLGTTAGDANLDGVFDSHDIVEVMIANEYEDDIPANSTWATGDFDGDREFTSADFVLAMQESIYEPTIVEFGAAPASYSLMHGDTNRDGKLDVEDLDLLNRWVGPALEDSMYLEQLDINVDGRVNRADVDMHAKYFLGTTYGDANLDGIFDSSDMVIVSLWGQYEDDETANSTWEKGDWNGDREFNSSDLVFALEHSIYEPLASLDIAAVDELLKMF